MNYKGKKLFAIMLTVMMLLQMMPFSAISAFADTEDTVVYSFY